MSNNNKMLATFRRSAPDHHLPHSTPLKIIPKCIEIIQHLVISLIVITRNRTSLLINKLQQVVTIQTREKLGKDRSLISDFRALKEIDLAGLLSSSSQKTNSKTSTDGGRSLRGAGGNGSD
jgi:uncharacterized protein involved in outer membrane biogenesis